MDKTKLVFLDTETTGRDADSRLCQVAYKIAGQEFESLFKPPVPIGIESMSICHITNKMVADKDPFAGSDMHKQLEDIFANDHIMVAHNADFDVEMLSREGLEIKNAIDTFKIAHHLDPEAQIPRFNLQYLRYYFDLDVSNAPAHDALGDVRVLEKLFEYFFQNMLEKFGSEEAVVKAMLEISAKPVLVKKFQFGKHRGKLVGEVALNDPGYLRWLFSEKMKAKENGEEDDPNWIYTLQHYLKIKVKV